MFYNILVKWGTIYQLLMLLPPKLMKVMNYTGLWDAKLAWYSQNATHQICLCGLEHSLGIYPF